LSELGLNATAYLTAKLHWRLGTSSVLRNTPQEQMARMRIGGIESRESTTLEKTRGQSPSGGVKSIPG
jgi:hypothetical protein